MAENAFVKIGTALLKHQVKKLVGEEALGVIGQELAGISGDRLDAWISEQATPEQLEKAAQYAHQCFRGKVKDADLEQWMVSLPLGNLPKVVEALEELPKSPDETKLEEALRESVSLNWKNLSAEQVDNAVNAFLYCLRSALLPIEKQTLMVIGRSVLRTEDRVALLVRWFEQYIITDKPAEVKRLSPEPIETWNLKHPYAMPPHFTGRVEERKILSQWIDDDNEHPLLILSALGGFGKSALAWHWLIHDVNPIQWPKVVWWSFYEGDSSFENFLEQTLRYLGIANVNELHPHDQVLSLISVLKNPGTLLILDGFERILNAYGNMGAAYQGDQYTREDNEFERNCIYPYADYFLRSLGSYTNYLHSKVLITSRLIPRAIERDGQVLQGCRIEDLSALEKNDAVVFFRTQGVTGISTDIEMICKAYGYHPLTLRLLVGLITNSRETPNDIAAAKKFDVSHDVKQNKHHVLEIAYNSLSATQKQLLGQIACFRVAVTYNVLKSIFSKMKEKETIDVVLDALEKRGLLHWDRKVNKYDLHPIVRLYAYERLTTSDRTTAHTRLRDYFAAVAIPTRVKSLDDLMPVVELFHHTVRAGEFDAAWKLFRDRLWEILYYQLGAYQTQVEILESLFFVDGNKLPKLKESDDQAFALNELANAYARNGQPRRAVLLHTQANILLEKTGNGRNLSIGLGNLAQDRLAVGALKTADADFQRAVAISHNEYDESIFRQEYGRLLIYSGRWQDARDELSSAIKLQQDLSALQAQSVTWAYRALRRLLMIRDLVQWPIENPQLIIDNANHALEFSKEQAEQVPVARDFIRAYWLLGSAYRFVYVWSGFTSALAKAEEHLNEALTRDRTINLVEMESDILLDLARLRYDQKKYEEAKSLAEEALIITERCGYILQGADVNLFLAQYTLEQENDKAKAKQYAEEALKLATCDGPPYYYKVAYEEAERMLEKLK
ncbi:MAG: hypothetical protein ACOYZ6_13420 [Chloroflexota bacterium]